MRTRSRAAVWSAGLAAVLLGTVVVCTAVGPVPLPVEGVAKALLATLPFVPVTVPETTQLIVTRIRLPRILLAATVGFALAAAGTVMQGFFRNPMADPSLVGVSSGAAVGAVAAIALPSLLPTTGLRVPAFVGGIVAAFAVYLIASTNGRTPVATLLLAGVAIQTFLGAVISFLLLLSGRSLQRAVYWLMGHLSNASYEEVAFVGGVCVVGMPILLAYAQDLNVMLLGEEDAGYLGVEVERTKRLLLVVSSVVTAGAVAVSGVIGFVGLIVPHVMRLLVGPDHRILLPTSALAGAAFLVATDTVARSGVFAGAFEIPVGIVTAALGAPFFLFLLRRREVTAL